MFLYTHRTNLIRSRPSHLQGVSLVRSGFLYIRVWVEFHRGAWPKIMTLLSSLRPSCPRYLRAVLSCACVCVVIPFILTSDLLLWTHQPGSHGRNVTQDFSTFLLRCLPLFLSREGFGHPFPSSTVKSNFVYP